MAKGRRQERQRTQIGRAHGQDPEGYEWTGGGERPASGSGRAGSLLLNETDERPGKNNQQEEQWPKLEKQRSRLGHKFAPARFPAIQTPDDVRVSGVGQ